MMRRLIVMALCAVMALAEAAQTQCGDTATVLQAENQVRAGNYGKALELFLKADATFEPNSTNYYGNLQHWIGYCYYTLGDKRTATVYLEKALKVFRNSDKYVKMLDFLESVYSDLGDVANMKRIAGLKSEKPLVTVADYLERAQYYDLTDERAKAKDLYLQAVEKVKTGTLAEKEDVYSAYAQHLYDSGERQSATEYYQLAANARQQGSGKDLRWASLMRIVALNRQLLEQWQEAYDAHGQALRVFEANGDTKKAYYCVSGMGNCMYRLERYDEAKALYDKALRLVDADKQSADYAAALRDVAKADVKLQRYDEAIAHLQTATGVYERLGDNSKLQATLVELNMAKTKAGQAYDVSVAQQAEAAGKAKRQEILNEERQNLPAYKQQFGDEGIEYVSSLGIVAELTYELEDKQQGVTLLEDYVAKLRSALRRAFVLQNEQERQHTWHSGALVLDEAVAHAFGYDSTTIGLANQLNALAYDAQLLSKGVLLNSSIEFGQVVENSGDSQLRADYAKAQELKAEVEQLQADGEADLTTLTQKREECDRLTLSLMQRCKEMADFTQYLSYTWRDVQAALGDRDVAIEFAELKNGVPWTNNVIVAYVVAKQLPAPLCVPICPRGIASMVAADTAAYTSEQCGTLVWGNLFQLIGGCERIYFSPAAELANLGIEYLTYQGKPVIDHCDVYRLSSTKELCRKREPLSLKHVALFGDIDYGSSGKAKTVSWRHTDELTGQQTDEQSGVVSFSPLDGTGKEIRAIEALLKSSHLGEGKMFVGAEASEQALRGLSGDTRLDVLHIATHGQYYGGQKATEAEAMECSMLALSGVNIPNTDMSTDGVVTASDIASLNLRHCGMAVLSACETGLGKLGSDGVFGLQRGFKNAGVGTLLMSLDKVNDAATTELMVQFYKALATGAASPNAALRHAQRHMRASGYDNPRLWASFIVLDGQ